MRSSAHKNNNTPIMNKIISVMNKDKIHPLLHKHLFLQGKMAFRDNRITAPELDQFIVATVQLTGRVLGAGAYGSVEEVEIPGATVAAKKLHQQLVNLGSPQQVRSYTVIFVD